MSDIIVTAIIIIVQIAMNCYLTILFSSTINKKTYSKKQIFSLVVITTISNTIAGIIGNTNILIKALICGIPTILTLKFVFKSNILKSTLITVVIYIFFATTELISMFIILIFSNSNPLEIAESHTLLLLLILIQMIIILLVVKLLFIILQKSHKFKQLSSIANSNQILNLVLILILSILPNTIIIATNDYSFDFRFLLVYCIQNILIISTIFIFFKRTLERDKAQSELIISELHNKTMINMVDGVRTLKHDYNNIIESLSGYVKTKEYDKLEEHINKVLKECNVVNSLSIITPELFNEPTIYGIMGAKYFLAIEKDITFDIKVTSDFSKVNFSMPELSRILGILLDNAIEATENIDDKYIRFEAIFDERKNADIIKVINTYDKSIDIDFDRIYDKGFSSKKVKSGIGLFEVKKLINKNKNSEIFAEIKNGKFVHTMTIERNI